MVKFIRSPDQLVRYVREHLSRHYKSIHRALQEGTVDDLGQRIVGRPPDEEIAWTIRVTSVTQTKWWISVTSQRRSGFGIVTTWKRVQDEQVRVKREHLCRYKITVYQENPCLEKE